MLVTRCFACLCLIIVQLVEFLPVLTGLDPRPEIHVTVRLKENDGELTLDVPSVVPKAWIESAQETLAGALGSDIPDRPLGTEFLERNGKEFIRLTLEFESIAAMEDALIGIELPSILGDTPLPGFFDTFDFQVVESTMAKDYELQATISRESATLWGSLLRLYYHVELPGTVVEHNGLDTGQDLPTWVLSPGEELTIYARSQTILDVDLPASQWWIGLLLALIGTALFVGAGIWAYRAYRRNGRKATRELDGHASDPLQGEYSSWSEAMEDVKGVHVSDYDGEYTSDYDEELLDY